jgi:hypothetical protein
MEEGQDERDWVQSSFLEGFMKHVGKLGSLLGDYEEEREAERVRVLRRERAAETAFVPEEDSDSDDEEDDPVIPTDEEMKPEEAKAAFERLVRERFIYGLLDSIDYDAVDWDDQLDSEDDREAEERWFDDDENED